MDECHRTQSSKLHRAMKQVLPGGILIDMETRDRLKSGRGNAMLVSDSIYAACRFFEAFSGTELKGRCAIVTSYSPATGHIAGEETGEGLTEELLKYDVYRKMLADHFGESEDAAMRTHTGATVFALAKRGHLELGLPGTIIREDCIGLAVGSAHQIEALNAFLDVGAPGSGLVIVIGGGRVGCEVARALAARGASVRIVERDPGLRECVEEVAEDVVIGDMTDTRVVKRAGIATAASLVLTTNEDATNIFLAVYCRKLNPDAIIVSRITHPANVEAIHRAGADFAVSDSQIKIQSVLAAVRGTEPMILGEGLDLFIADVPRSLEGGSLRGSGILARTGLAVLAVVGRGVVDPHPRPERELRRGERVLFVGTAAQRDEFKRAFK